MNDAQTDLAMELAEKLNSEFRRGALVLAVLGQLRTEHYGYSLRKSLADQGLDVEEGTLYPLIRRLEKQALLESEWREDAKRRKRFYRLSAVGRVVLERLLSAWQALNDSIEEITRVSDALDTQE